MNSDTSERIINLLKQNGRMRPHDLLKKLDIKKAALHRQLLKLQQQGNLKKIGLPPRVYYQLTENTNEKIKETSFYLSASQKKLLADFALITPSGTYLKEKDAFIYWCSKHNLPAQKTLSEYEKTRGKYDQYKQKGLIDGMNKLRATFKEDVFLDELYYLDFYSIERFGRTKLGQLTLYAKQSQNKQLMQELTETARPFVLQLIEMKKIDAVCFVPPTVKRETQLMYELEELLSLNLPKIKFEKIRTEIIIPQKTISNLNDRVENAHTTLYLGQEIRHFQNLLIVDDAVGSGATMNTAAELLKAGKVCKKAIGMGLTGSFKGFEVIAEV